MSHSSNTRRGKADEIFLQAIACGATVEIAATRAGISRATAFRRMNAPHFQESLKGIRNDIITRTHAFLNAATGEAARTLLQLLQANHSSTARLGASKAIIELTCKLRDHEEFEARLRAIEDRFDEGHNVLT